MSAARPSVVTELTTLLGQLFGINPDDIAHDVSLVEMGADSLFLLQASQAIRDKFGVKLPFRMMLEEYSTVEALSNYIGQNVSGYEIQPDSANGDSQPALPVSEAIPSEPETVPVAAEVSQPSMPLKPAESFSGNGGNGSTPSNLERIFAQQLNVMSRQLALLRTER